jgi:NAD(P)H-hydrate epimerase
MAGAAALAGRAALRGGAGLVTIAAPDVVADVVAGFDPCYMTLPLPSRDGCLSETAQTALEPALAAATTIACGPGLGRTKGVASLVLWLYRTRAEPIVLDADALYALALEKTLPLAGGPRILTPHLGEFRRLAGDASLTLANAQASAVRMAHDAGVVVLLKGHRTLVTDGRRSAHNQTGNPGMASGGCGDVLTGLAAALLAQGLSVWDAARLGAHVHGLAGDLAAQQLGEVSLTAADLVDYVPAAWRSLAEQ